MMMANTQKTGRYADIANRLIAVREVYELNAREFAERAGIDPTRYYKFETGDNRISVDGALMLRETYNLPLDFIYCGSIDALPHKLAVAVSSSPRDSHSSKSTVSPED